MPAGFHRCPCGCDANIPNRMFACRAGWARLPFELQAAIVATAHRTLADTHRAEIVSDAYEFLQRNPPPPKGSK